MRRVLLTMVVACAATAGEAGCRLALALGLDVSGSVDETEFALQMSGLANALLRPEVQEALFAFPEAPVRLTVFQWGGGQGDQATMLPWVTLDGLPALVGAAERLRAAPRAAMSPETAIGLALRYGAARLDGQPGCWRRTLDLSGDGKNNAGPRPREVTVPGITVNGLVIGADPRHAGDRRQAEIGELQAYYSAEVIRGPEAFTEVALGFQDFEEAMARKLLKELRVLAIARGE